MLSFGKAEIIKSQKLCGCLFQLQIKRQSKVEDCAAFLASASKKNIWKIHACTFDYINNHHKCMTASIDSYRNCVGPASCTFG